MAECFNCFISGTKEQLLDGISSEGIVKVCAKCSAEEDIPLVRKPDGFALKESEKRQTVYERLSGVAGINKNENKKPKKQETSLREIVDRNFESSVKETKPRDDLIDNFHWVIMRMRRLKKVTQEQLGDEIGESGMAIKMAEKGVVPEGYEFIKKLENYFGIRLIKKDFAPKEEPKIQVVDSELLGKPEEIFEEEKSKALTISDLQEMKRKKEELVFNKPVSEEEPEFVRKEDFVEEEIFPPTLPKKETSISPKEEEIEKKDNDISKEEIDKILFGK